MQERVLDKNKLAKTEDWVGNNIAVTCPVCGKVYVVSGALHPEGRKCPDCGESVGHVDKKGENAKLYWE